MAEETQLDARFIVGFTTTGSLEEARRIARTLVEEKLAACVNIVPSVESYYWWDGAVQCDAEAKLIIKTRAELADPLIQRIRNLHSYDVCEVTCIPLMTGNPDYLAWIEANTKGQSTEALR